MLTVWTCVLCTAEMRYPKHPQLPLMVSSEVTSRDQTQLDYGKESWCRQNVVENPAVPRILKYAFGRNTMEFEETYELDHYARTMVEIGKNISCVKVCIAIVKPVYIDAGENCTGFGKGGGASSWTSV